MKHHLKTYLKTFVIMFAAAAVVIIAAQAGMCDAGIAEHAPDIASQTAQNADSGRSDAIAKFLIAMGGVVLSTLIIFFGLTIYNRFFVDKRLFQDNNPDDVLNTPKTVEEAVTLYIKRNKLC